MRAALEADRVKSPLPGRSADEVVTQTEVPLQPRYPKKATGRCTAKKRRERERERERERDRKKERRRGRAEKRKGKEEKNDRESGRRENGLSTKTGRNKDEGMARSVLLGREARSLEIIIIAARRG